MIEIGMHEIIKNFGFSNVLNGASFEIMTGDRTAIVGKNGTGKSTLLKVISGEENVQGGSVFVRKGATTAYLEQIPKLADKNLSTREILMQPFTEIEETEKRLRTLELQMASETDGNSLDKIMRQYAHHQEKFEHIGGYDVEEKFARIVTGFSLTDLLERSFFVLSGGQKTIVTLAASLLLEPDILLLDEPTNHLDIKTLEWFEGYLAKYRGTVLFVSHDRYFLDRVATKTIVLDSGKCTLYHGNYTFSQQEEERRLMIEFEQYKNQQKKIEAMEAAIKRYRDWGNMGDNEKFFKKAKELENRLEKMEMLEKPQLERQKIPMGFAGVRTGRDVVRLKDASLSFGDLHLLRDVTATIFYRDRICMMGSNGSGKTSLLRLILAAESKSSPSIFIASTAKIGYIPQEIHLGTGTQTVVDVFRQTLAIPEGKARGILAKYGFYKDHVNKRVVSLSGGEKVLLKLAMLVQQEVNFLVLDEPTNHIDIEKREMLEEALLSFAGTILFVSHDRYFIAKMATRIFRIEAQSIACYEGDYEWACTQFSSIEN